MLLHILEGLTTTCVRQAVVLDKLRVVFFACLVVCLKRTSLIHV